MDFVLSFKNKVYVNHYYNNVSKKTYVNSLLLSGFSNILDNIYGIAKRISILTPLYYYFNPLNKYVSELITTQRLLKEVDRDKYDQNPYSIDLKLICIYRNLYKIICRTFSYNTFTKFYNILNDLDKDGSRYLLKKQLIIDTIINSNGKQTIDYKCSKEIIHYNFEKYKSMVETQISNEIWRKSMYYNYDYHPLSFVIEMTFFSFTVYKMRLNHLIDYKFPTKYENITSLLYYIFNNTRINNNLWKHKNIRIYMFYCGFITTAMIIEDYIGNVSIKNINNHLYNSLNIKKDFQQ